ncbi:piggyBac transposable element-derived protein 4-like [Vespula maculifrons]|uniref:PiggyBac transposable element-derived protein 4-like n=1 Tax=Vespula maculifrons TaxID=7453 RepID=A0ABD2CFE8_VESMC
MHYYNLRCKVLDSNPNTNLIVDEHLFPTKIRCKFTRYKVYSFSYLGKEKSRPLDEFVVLKLVSSIGCWRNITTDNFFTSASLATKLLAKRTTLLSNVRATEGNCPTWQNQQKAKWNHKNVKIDKNKKRITETVPIVVLDGLLQWHVQIFFSTSLIWLISMHGYFIKKPMDKIYPNNNIYCSSLLQIATISISFTNSRRVCQKPK